MVFLGNVVPESKRCQKKKKKKTNEFMSERHWGSHEGIPISQRCVI